MSEQFYDFSMTSLQGKKIKMDDYKGKVVVIVNTASKCGFTPQYEGLEKLHQKYNKDGLVILGFPCNQFGGQEPGNATDIQENCLINYGVSFPIGEKIEVNGANANPLFKFLKHKCRGFLSSKIKWNFTKFVIDKNGKPVKRFGSITTPEKMESYLVDLLKKN